jgi:hypothetical protein
VGVKLGLTTYLRAPMGKEATEKDVITPTSADESGGGPR